MVDEVISDVRRIAQNKRLKNIFTLIFVYLMRVLIAFIPVTILEIIKFIISTLFNILNAHLLSQGFNFVYSLIVEIVSVATYIFTSPFLFGCINYFLNEAKGEKNDEKLTKYIHNHKLCYKQMLMILRLSFFTLIGLLCFIVPGIIYLSKRIMAPLLLIEDESLGINEAIVKSIDIMEKRYKELIKVIIKILLPSAIMYILGSYVAHFNAATRILGNIMLFITFIMFIIALSDAILAIAVMYTKITGKKQGAIDVEYREIND